MKCLICGAEQTEFVTWWEQWCFEKCRDCGVFFTAPPPEHEVVSRYVNGSILGESEDGVPTEELVFPAWKHDEHAFILDRLRALGVRQGSLLDVGCLWGSFLSHAHQTGFDVVGVEPFGNAVRYVDKILKIKAYQGTLRSPGFSAESFDVVTMLDVIEHLPDPVSELSEVHRVAKPDSLLVVDTPNVAALSQRLVNLKHRLLGEQWHPFDTPPWHLWGFTEQSIIRCVESGGFTVESVDFLEHSLRTTNLGAGGTLWKRKAFKVIGSVCVMAGISDRMAVFARKRRL